MAEDILQWLALIPGVTQEKARNLKVAGFESLDDLREASTEEIARVEGISPILAQRIKNYLGWVNGEEAPEETLLLCPECGVFISADAAQCPHCGAAFEEGVEEADFPGPSPAREAPPALHMCPECGAFVSSSANSCTHCGAVFEAEEEWVEPEVPTPSMEGVPAELPLAPCPLCGTLVGHGTTVCPNCGASFEKVEDAELGRFLDEMGEFERRAKEAVKEARPPERATKPKGIVRDFLSRWERATEEKKAHADPEAALDHYDRLLEVDPTLERVWVKRAEVLRELGREEEAMEAYARAAELNPTKRAEYKLEVMDILRTREDVSVLPPEWEGARPVEGQEAVLRALEQYERLLEADATLLRAWQVKAELLEILGRSEEAAAALLTAAELRRKEGEKRLTEIGRLEGEEVTPPRRPRPSDRPEAGMVNGLEPGRVNGLGPGRVNGLDAGRVNGLVNGTTVGRVNGLVNGTTLGRVNGLSVAGGRVNGLINGTGLTNGRIDLFRPPISPPNRRWVMNSVGVAAVLFLMILAPLLLNVLFVTEGAGIAIDGNFDDWAAVPAYSDALMDVQGNPDVNLVSYKVQRTPESVSVFAQVQGTLLNGRGASGMDSFFVLMDRDGSEETGYRIAGLGVDVRVEVTGWNGTIHSAKEQLFDNEGSQDDWNAFIPRGGIRASARGDKMELTTFVPNPAKILLVAADVAGNIDPSDAIVGPPQVALTIEQRSLAPALITSTQVPMLALDVRPHGGAATLQSLTATVTGTYPPGDLSLSLLDENRLVLSTAIPSGRDVTLPLSMDLDAPRSFQVTASLGSLVPRASLGVRVTGAESNGTVSVRDSIITSSYVLSPPEPTVDGAFADWVSVSGLSDRDDDVFNAGSPVEVNENVDLRGYRMHVSGNTTFFAEVDQNGRMLGGADIPSLKARPPIAVTEALDSDDDTVPDVFEPENMTVDFNNDGVPDSQSTVLVQGQEFPDKDADGIADYPDGPDLWLNTTIPDWFPPDYRGRAVRVYIGPISRQVIEGTERIQIYVDSDGAMTGLPVASGGEVRGMDYVLLVEGRQGQVRSSSLYAYNPDGAIPWEYVEDATAAVDSFRLEVAVDSGSLPLNDDFAVLFRTMDWRGSRDDSDDVLGNATAGRGTRAIPPVTKTLYLHDDGTYDKNDPEDLMDTKPPAAGPLGDYDNDGDPGLTIKKGFKPNKMKPDKYQDWVLTPPFAKPFHITGDTTLHLWSAMKDFDTTLTGIVEARLYDDNDANLVASTSLTESNWVPADFKQLALTFSNVQYTLPAGNALVLRIFVHKKSDDHMWFAYDTAAYASRIDVPTDTYINVDSVKTYNATAETSVFFAGDTVLVRGNVSDPIGSYDITGARITIHDPDGIPIVDDQPMSLEQTDPRTPSAWKLFNYTYALPGTAKAGRYRVDVQAVESNGVTHNGTMEFIVPKEYDVFVYPDQSSSAHPGLTVDYVFTIQNVGLRDDYFEIKASSSNQSWTTRLFFGTAWVAEDLDGDGVWDTVNATYDYDSDGIPEVYLAAGDSSQWTMQKVLPLGTEGLVDVTSLIATSETDSNGTDSASATTTSTALAVVKTTYLHDDGTYDKKDPEDLMDTKPPAAGPLGDYDNDGDPGLTIKRGFDPQKIKPDKYQDWVLTPPFARPFHITGDVTVYLWSAMKNFDTTLTGVIVGRLYDNTSAQLIATATVTQSTWPAGDFLEVSLDMTGVDYTIPAGNALVLRVIVPKSSDDHMWFAYDTAAYPSRIDLPTDSYVHVDEIRTYNGTVETTTFAAGDDVLIRGNVSDPFGSYDISGAEVTITYPNGTTPVDNATMALEKVDPSTPSVWRLFNYTHTLPTDAPVGEYTVFVKGIESDGATHMTSRVFTLPSNVSVEPDNNGTADPGTLINYTHYVNNTGSGEDIYDLTVFSDSGFNLTIFSGGVIMGYDSNGDGVWEFVDPAFDSNANGLPDTGALLPGGSFTVILQVEVPLGTQVQLENSTITATSSLIPVVEDSATDFTRIPEFDGIAIPMAMVFVIVLGTWRRKKRTPRPAPSAEGPSKEAPRGG